MFKQKRFILSVLLCTVGMTAIFGFDKAWAMSWFGSKKIDAPLLSVRFGSGGDMLGSSHSLEVTAVDNSHALITYEDAEWHAQDPIVKEFKVDLAVLEDIKAIFNEKGMASWEKCPQSKEQVLDGATSGYSFRFADKRSVRFSSTQELPEGAYAALRRIRELAQSYCKKGELLPGLVTIPVKPEDMFNPREIVPGKITLQAYQYRDKMLYARLGNGTNDVITVKEDYLLTKEGKPLTLVPDKYGLRERNVHPNYNEEFSIKLAKRLEAGKYFLNIDGHTTEFSIE